MARQVTGLSTSANPNRINRAFVLRNGVMQGIGSLGGPNSDDAGRIVANAIRNGAIHAVLLTPLPG
jgi:probable HAF family extracellular repeat protein